MTGIYLNHDLSDAKRRDMLFRGELLVYSRNRATAALCEHAQKTVEEAFGDLDPQRAQYSIDIPKFVEIVAPLKSKFTNDLRTKELLRDVLEAYGCDLERTFFDVPRLRIGPSDGWLSAGVSYAYKAHRDTWYSSPDSQVNWWLPVYDVTNERSMSFYTDYWDKPIANSSGDFDYAEWCAVGRQQAISQTSVDTRKHPLPTEPVREAGEFRICGTTGDLLLFSAAHLHASGPNTSGLTRYSMDFRTVSLDDLEQGKGAPNIDNKAKGTTLGDFFRASDLTKIDITRFQREYA